MGRLVEKLHPEKYAVMQWHMQAGNITTNLKVKVDFTLPELVMTNVLTWKIHVDNSAKGRYYMILGQYILTQLGLNLNISEHVIKADGRPFKGSTTPMVDLGKCVFIYLNTQKIIPEESFNDAEVE